MTTFPPLQGARPLLQPLDRKPLGDEVYRALRRLIVQGQLRPGDKIVEGGLASELGVSRTPVREALQRLEYDGLLVTHPGRSTRVTAFTISDVEEIYPLIAALEGLAASLATPRLNAADLLFMEDLTRAMARHARNGDTEKLLAADNQFHGVLHECSRNRRLQRIVHELRGQMERFEYAFFSSPQVVNASLKRHRKLVRVLAAGNPERAERTLQRQWQLGQRALLEMIREKKLGAYAPGDQTSVAGIGLQVRKKANESR